MSLDKAYAPQAVEERWISAWKKAGLFSPAPDSGAAPKFVVVIPPPNVTGALHLGHALNNALQDVLVRWRRMSGDRTCWVPGTDHGGIATQNVMEKQLKAENLSRHDLGREKFLERMQEWTRECKKTILGQLEKLGCALDFSREAFTMDEARARAVRAAFKALWDKKLIYRGRRMVNWCVRCGTALSDIEVEYEERKGRLWHIHYPLADNSEGVVVATTRPETLLGDTAVAVNAKDSRYAHLVGKKLRLPLLGREIPVVADEAVDMAFGTGAVKVTPAHDPADFEIGERHALPSIAVISFDGRISAEGGLYAGLSREQARQKIVEDLKASALLRKEEDYK
ncbi:MAG: class I tRNA ligase family protein, partial [Elusimicrobia bacterium]|nr:class I tRNA ligase family protein [Elusimicrobiota bacterium]